MFPLSKPWVVHFLAAICTVHVDNRCYHYGEGGILTNKRLDLMMTDELSWGTDQVNCLAFSGVIQQEAKARTTLSFLPLKLSLVKKATPGLQVDSKLLWWLGESRVNPRGVYSCLKPLDLFEHLLDVQLIHLNIEHKPVWLACQTLWFEVYTDSRHYPPSGAVERDYVWKQFVSVFVAKGALPLYHILGTLSNWLATLHRLNQGTIHRLNQGQELL